MNTLDRNLRSVHEACSHPMKHVRIELHVTAFVHIGENLNESAAPIGIPFHKEDLTITRTALLGENDHRPATTKAHALSMLSSLASVLPEKLAHAARLL